MLLMPSWSAAILLMATVAFFVSPAPSPTQAAPGGPMVAASGRSLYAQALIRLSHRQRFEIKETFYPPHAIGKTDVQFVAPAQVRVTYTITSRDKPQESGGWTQTGDVRCSLPAPGTCATHTQLNVAGVVGDLLLPNKASTGVLMGLYAYPIHDPKFRAHANIVTVRGLGHPWPSNPFVASMPPTNIYKYLYLGILTFTPHTGLPVTFNSTVAVTGSPQRAHPCQRVLFVYS